MNFFSNKKANIFLCLLLFFAAGSVDAQEKNIAWYISHAPFKMPAVIVPEFANKTFSITDYGAVSDGQALNTSAFEKAINACTAAGGGRVLIPAGLWLTGPIQLKSNVDLHAERGALVIFTKDHTQYPMIRSSNTGNSIVPASPIYGYDLKNIAISGEGIFDGSGETWRPVKKLKVTASEWKELTATGVVSTDGSVWWPTKEAMEGEDFLKQLRQKNAKPSPDDYLPARDFLRPYMLYLVNCQNVLIENVTLRNSPKFVFYPNNCTNLTVRYVNIFNEYSAQNGDGMDISACKNVVVYKCNVSAGDDGICMKSSGNNTDKTKANLENLVIAGCNVYHAHGGFVIGSNTDGGMQNIFVTDCNFVGTDIGIRVKSNAGRGGLVKNIFISNIFMRDIVNDAISFDTYYEDVPAGKTKTTSTAIREKTPEFTDFRISNVYCSGAKTAVSLTGLPEMPVHNIYFNNITISAQHGFVATDAADLDLKKVKIITPGDPVYTLQNVKNINIAEGYFPPMTKVLVKGDNKTTGVNVTGTDLRNSSSAIQVEK